MTSRTGQVESQVNVEVSSSMGHLRSEQMGLNFFLWTTELGYGFIHTSDDQRLTLADTPAMSAFSNVQSEAWFPNTAGRLKYGGTVKHFLDQLKRNAAVAAHATAVLWYSKFEQYLHERVGAVAGTRKSWGPLTKTLRVAPLIQTVWPIRPMRVLRADFCREVRNAMVHRESEVPRSVDHPRVVEWKKRSEQEMEHPAWRCANPAREVADAAQYVVGEVANHLKAAEAEGKDLTPSFFYALFSFTNYDLLAFEIEEALISKTSNEEEMTTVRRQERHVRRRELIVPRCDHDEEAPNPGAAPDGPAEIGATCF